MSNSIFPTKSSLSTTAAVACPSCGSRMESLMVKQLFSIWTATDETDKDPFQTVERVVHLMRCSVCGYEEYEVPE